MRDHDDDHDFTGGRHGGAPMPNISAKSSPDDVKREMERLINRNEQEFRDTFKAKIDGDQANFIGLKLPKYLAPIANVVHSVFIVPISTMGSSFVYNKSFKLAEQFHAPRDKAHLIGAGLEATVRWGIIASLPLFGFAAANKDYLKKRRELYRQFKPIIETSKIDYKNNEVVKTAFDHLHDDYAFSLKRLIPSLISFGIQVPYALEQHRKIVSERNSQFSALGDLGKSIEERTKALLGKVTDKVKVNSAIADAIEAEKAKYLKTNKNKKRPYDNKRMSQEELEQEFEQNIGKSLRSEFIDYNKPSTEASKPASGGFLDNQQYPLLLTAVSATGEGISTAINESRNKFAKINSWEMIKHLKDVMDSRYNDGGNGHRGRHGRAGRSADDISISMLDAGEEGKRHSRRADEVSLRQYVLEVFQQLERDRGRAEMGGPLLEQLMPSVDLIAEYIADGRLDAYALVNLAGGNKIIQHRSSGARIFANNEQVQKEIDALTATLSTKEEVTEAELLANHTDPASIMRVIKRNLDSMQGKEKAVFASFFPVEILVKSNIKKQDAIELHKQGHALLYEAVAGATLAIAHQLATEDPEGVKKMLGISDEQIKEISALAAKLEQGDWKAVETAVDGHDKGAMVAARTAGLELDSKGKSPWVEWVKNGAQAHKEIQEAPKENEEEKSRAVIHERGDDAAEERRERAHAHKHKKQGDGYAEKYHGEKAAKLTKSAVSRLKNDPAGPDEGLFR